MAPGILGIAWLPLACSLSECDTRHCDGMLGPLLPPSGNSCGSSWNGVADQRGANPPLVVCEAAGLEVAVRAWWRGAPGRGTGAAGCGVKGRTARVGEARAQDAWLHGVLARWPHEEVRARLSLAGIPERIIKGGLQLGTFLVRDGEVSHLWSCGAFKENGGRQVDSTAKMVRYVLERFDVRALPSRSPDGSVAAPSLALAPHPHCMMSPASVYKDRGCVSTNASERSPDLVAREGGSSALPTRAKLPDACAGRVPVPPPSTESGCQRVRTVSLSPRGDATPNARHKKTVALVTPSDRHLPSASPVETISFFPSNQPHAASLSQASSVLPSAQPRVQIRSGASDCTALRSPALRSPELHLPLTSSRRRSSLPPQHPTTGTPTSSPIIRRRKTLGTLSSNLLDDHRSVSSSTVSPMRSKESTVSVADRTFVPDSSFGAWLRSKNKKRQSVQEEEDVSTTVVAVETSQVDDSQPSFTKAPTKKAPKTIKDVMEVRRIFENYDKDKSGTLTSIEFIPLLARLLGYTQSEMDRDEAWRNWDAVDVDNVGHINYDVFEKWYCQTFAISQMPDFRDFFGEDLIPQDQRVIRAVAKSVNTDVVRVEKIWRDFNILDEDGSGRLEKDEFKVLIERLLSPGEDDPEVPPKVIEKFWMDVDSDGSGFVSFEEFAAWYVKFFASDASPMEHFYATLGTGYRRTSLPQAHSLARGLLIEQLPADLSSDSSDSDFCSSDFG